MTEGEIKTRFRERHIKFSNERDLVARKIKSYALLRLISFLGLIIVAYFSSTWSWIALVAVLTIGIVAFVSLVRKHNYYHRRKDVLDQLIRINGQEEALMDWDFGDLDDGSEYCDEAHLFSYDLDLFGKGSLFQYINRTSTNTGKTRLAAWLSYIEKDKQEILQRQQAVKELAPILDWRQDFRVQGMLTEEDPQDIKGLVEWVGLPPDFKSVFFQILIIVVPLINLFMFILSMSGIITFWHFLAYLVIPLMVASIRHRKVNLKHNRLSRKYQVLKKYSRLFNMIEKYEFSSERMKELKGSLFTEGTSASKAIRNLARIANAFDTRLNLLAGFLMNIFFLWDIRQSIRLERWQKKYRGQLSQWFDAIGEADTYISFAGYAYSNPAYIFPEILNTEKLLIESTQLGHPLIHSGKRVCNDYTVDGWGRFTILTGANMAGKSTFLRTVGMNMILSSCGAPVCAKTMTINPVDLVTSIHTIDSLANNESYFYAELKRLQMIIELLKEGQQIFIILDEILKGTNSRDKQSGSKALVRQLIQMKAAGIIATHDLSLGELEKQFPAHVTNQCFEINIEKEQLEYDYTLRNGIAENMNATILMERMGITINS